MWIHTELLLEKTDRTLNKVELIEVPFVFNSNSIVAAWPKVTEDEEVSEVQRRHCNVTLLDGQHYLIKHKYSEVLSWLDPSSGDGNKENAYSPLVPPLNVSL